MPLAKYNSSLPFGIFFFFNYLEGNEFPNGVSSFLNRAAYTEYEHVVCVVGANELAVQKAKTEITRLIKEELIRLVSIFLLTHVKMSSTLIMQWLYAENV